MFTSHYSPYKEMCQRCLAHVFSFTTKEQIERCVYAWECEGANSRKSWGNLKGKFSMNLSDYTTFVTHNGYRLLSMSNFEKESKFIRISSEI